MVHNRPRLMLLSLPGDAFVLFIISLFGLLSPATGEVDDPAQFIFWIWFTLFAVWTVATLYLEKKIEGNNWKKFLLKVSLAWFVAIGFALLIRSLAYGLPLPLFGFLMWLIIDGLFYLLVWRGIFKVFVWLFSEGRQPILRWLTIAGIGIGIVGILVTGGLYWRTQYAAQQVILSAETAVPSATAIVFGAHVWWDGTPSTTLIHRVEKAAELYNDGKVDRLLLSGDGRTAAYNEPKAMETVALELNIPQEALVLDYYGLRTYDTCARANALFGVSEAVLVTQAFQLPRAIMLCEHHGIASIGVPVDEDPTDIRQQAQNTLREVLATLLAYVDQVTNPAPVAHNDISY